MHREERPRDFFGFDDYTGGDPQDDIDAIKRAQAKWDARRTKQPWWMRLLTSRA